jgi:peptidyl-prolyl isomerase D
VVFGRVIQGLNEVFRVIEKTPKGSNDRPVQPCIIADCGMYDEKNPPAPFVKADA